MGNGKRVLRSSLPVDRAGSGPPQLPKQPQASLGGIQHCWRLNAPAIGQDRGSLMVEAKTRVIYLPVAGSINRISVLFLLSTREAGAGTDRGAEPGSRPRRFEVAVAAFPAAGVGQGHPVVG